MAQGLGGAWGAGGLQEGSLLGPGGYSGGQGGYTGEHSKYLGGLVGGQKYSMGEGGLETKYSAHLAPQPQGPQVLLSLSPWKY